MATNLPSFLRLWRCWRLLAGRVPRCILTPGGSGQVSSAKYLGEGTSRGEQRRNPLLPLTFLSSPLWRGHPRPRCFDCSSVGHKPLTRGHRRPRLCWPAKLASGPLARAPPPAIRRREAIDSPYSVPLVTSFHISP